MLTVNLLSKKVLWVRVLSERGFPVPFFPDETKGTFEERSVFIFDWPVWSDKSGGGGGFK